MALSKGLKKTPTIYTKHVSFYYYAICIFYTHTPYKLITGSYIYVKHTGIL